MEIRKVLSRFRQFGGFRLLLEYARMGIGLRVLHHALLYLVGKESRDTAYAYIKEAVNKKLNERYLPYLKERKAYYDSQQLPQTRSNKVWTCWLQGFDKAPEIVRVCQESLKRQLKPDRELIQLDDTNYQQYVTLPTHVVERYKRGQMPPAHFSDILRLELLTRYGGTWMDASILCTGRHHAPEMLDSDLFIFQQIVYGDWTFHGISNWFITSCTNNRLLLVLRDLLCKYWSDYSVTLNYYIFHSFFRTLAGMYPDDIAAMTLKDRNYPLMLNDRLNEPYDPEWTRELTSRVCFHKICCRIYPDILANKTNFYHAIINGTIA